MFFDVPSSRPRFSSGSWAGLIRAERSTVLDAEGLALNGNGVTGVALIDGSDTMIGGYSANDRNVMTAADCDPGCENFYDNMIHAWLFGWNRPAFGTPKKFNHAMHSLDFVMRILDRFIG